MERKGIKELGSVIEPLEAYHNYFIDYDEVKAKRILTKFYFELKNFTPEKQIIIKRHSYYSFYINLLLIMQALEKKKYSEACHEICTLNYYESILQKRVYNSLMRLLHNYLEWYKCELYKWLKIYITYKAVKYKNLTAFLYQKIWKEHQYEQKSTAPHNTYYLIERRVLWTNLKS